MQNLKYLKNPDLDLRMKNLARQERELLATVLETIREIDKRKLYVELGYPNLFSYLVEGVGYSAASAQRRIDGARLLNEIPEVSNKIESGEIKLTQISVLQKAVRELKRTRNVKIASSKKLELLETLSGKTHQETEKQVARFFNLPVMSATRERVQADECVRLELTLTKKQSEKLKLAQALISHAVPTNDVVAFIEYICEKIIKQKTVIRNEKATVARVEQKTDALNGYTLEVSPSKKSTKGSRQKNTQDKNSTQNFSARTRKLILQKYKCCQYRDPKTQKQCGSRWFLQIDHRQSKWAGGTNDKQNANLLCAIHNREKYLHEQQQRWV